MGEPKRSKRVKLEPALLKRKNPSYINGQGF